MGGACGQYRLIALTMRTARRFFRQREYLVKLALQPVTESLVFRIRNGPIVPHPRHHRVEYAFGGCRYRHDIISIGRS